MAADQLTDKEDQFRRRARRRLVGAVALVLLMITILPMVLDDRSGKNAPQPEIAISIPSQEGADFASKIVPVAPATAVTAPPVVPMASPVEKPAEALAPTKPVEEKPVSSKPSVAAEAKPAAKPSTDVPAVPVKEEASSPAKPVEEAKSKPVVEPKSKPASAIKKGSISVQIGVFSDAPKVKQMRARIAEQGIQCYSEIMNTPKGTKYRVRCGPYADKPAAQQALDTLKAAGYNGILVTNQ